MLCLFCWGEEDFSVSIGSFEAGECLGEIGEGMDAIDFCPQLPAAQEVEQGLVGGLDVGG